MRKFTKFFALSLSLGLVAGGLVALANSKAQNKNMIETRADSAFVEPTMSLTRFIVMIGIIPLSLKVLTKYYFALPELPMA